VLKLMEVVLDGVLVEHSLNDWLYWSDVSDVGCCICLKKKKKKKER
jgi:hypothetical protein